MDPFFLLFMSFSNGRDYAFTEICGSCIRTFCTIRGLFTDATTFDIGFLFFHFLISLSARIFCFCRLYIFQFFSSFVACQPGSGVILAIFLYLSSLATHNQEQSFLRP